MRTQVKTNIQIIVAILLVILMGILRGIRFQYTYLDVIFFLLNYVVYTVLYLSWIISIGHRIMQKNIKTYLLSIGILLLFWFFVRTAKYKYFILMPQYNTFLWYLYYVPIILIPLLGYYIAVNVGTKEETVISPNQKLLWIPAVILIVTVLTNDIHQTVFSFSEDMDLLFKDVKDYQYNIVYYIIEFWVVSLMCVTLFLIFQKSRFKERKRRVLIPFSVILSGMLYSAFYNMNQNHAFLQFFELTIVFGMMTILFWESCIQIGLIPSNKKYDMFFSESMLETLITDSKGNICYGSHQKSILDQSLFEELKENKRVFKEEAEYQLYAIQGGYVVWKSDISSLLKLVKELENINMDLEDELGILQNKLNTDKKMLHYNEKKKLYALIYEHIEPRVKRLERCLLDIKLRGGTREKWERVYVLGTYIKRSGNLVLISQSGDCSMSSDLECSLRETIENLKQMGIAAGIENRLNGAITAKQVLKLYDSIQAITEVTLPHLEEFFVMMRSTETEHILSVLVGGKSIGAYVDRYRKMFRSVEKDMGSIHITLKLPKEVSDVIQ